MMERHYGSFKKAVNEEDGLHQMDNKTQEKQTNKTQEKKKYMGEQNRGTVPYEQTSRKN